MKVQVEKAELALLQIKSLKSDLERAKISPGALPFPGCMSHSCLVQRPMGAGTNGGCSCDTRKLQMALQWMRQWVEFQQATLQAQRDEIARLEYRVSELGAMP